MTTTLTQQDKQLKDALDTAVTSLQAECRKKTIIARDVRAILYDIGANALMSLPAPVQVLLPPNNDAIMETTTIYSMIGALRNFKNTLG